ncbi:MAG: Maf family protein [Syntrophobacterales bacterium]|nr:Maf family protein [Syntrophobacterales bacterium]
MGIVIPHHIILASASPRRIELLKLAGLSFDVIPADIEEAPRPGEAPDKHVFGSPPKRPCLSLPKSPIVSLSAPIRSSFSTGKFSGNLPTGKRRKKPWPN